MRATLLLAVATLALWFTPIVGAAAPLGACGAGKCASAPTPAAQKERNETLLDKVGLGSLRDVPWEALPAALALSAAIGAAGGFIYAGILGARGPAEDRRAKKEADRSSS